MLEKSYNPKDVEAKLYAEWLDKKYFHANPDTAKEVFSIVIPPPNVTGILTMGHVLNNTIQDILVRWNRMEGFETLWLPGTDHAGIATQNVVEKRLLEKGITRASLGREKFVEEVWKWKNQYGATIVKQLHKLGCSCDWERERFTMDEGLSKAVMKVFVDLYNKGLVYRGSYIINWCPRCATALSDEEVEYRDTKGSLYYLKYPIKGSKKFVTVATTRPETMLGDVAVAVNPKDKKYKHLVGKTVLLPFMRRELPVIADDFVDPKFGTGAVKVTPAHDPNDFDMGQRHGLTPISVMNGDGTMNENAGDFQGLNRYECRERVVEGLRDRGFLAKVEEHDFSVGHCSRCETVTEPHLSLQWFVKMKPLAERALEAYKNGSPKIFPKRWEKVYVHWLENIRDWCISRQLWWGHRIPVWYCTDAKCAGLWVGLGKPDGCPTCKSPMRQDEDVLDTWFSSWLWPFSTLGWPENTPDLKRFYPTSTLVTGHDIIFFWVARMVMAGLEFTGEVPFKNVYLTGMVRDEQGRRMSKSLGNSPDPIEVIDEFGADALRFSMCLLTPQGQDILFSKSRLETGRHFANKLWNASRFVLMNAGEIEASAPADTTGLGMPDKWILSRFSGVARDVTRLLKTFRLNEASAKIYEFVWGDFCDWYLEMAKLHMMGESPESADSVRKTMKWTLSGILRLLHPFMPFITEELWQLVRTDGSSIVCSEWPKAKKNWTDKKTEYEMEIVQKVVAAVRNLRSEMNVPPGKKASCIIRVSGEEKEILERCGDYVRLLGKLDRFEAGASIERPGVAATSVLPFAEIFLPLEGLIDVESERKRLSKELERVVREFENSKRKLSNEDFLSKARKEVVEKEKDKLVTLSQTKANLEKSLASLKLD